MDNITFHIYVVYDKEKVKSEIPSCEWLTPLNVNKDNGINIGSYTKYCELRAQYYIWKNNSFFSDSSIGFFHFRRYLDLKYLLRPEKKCKRPYTIKKNPNILSLNPLAMSESIRKYDIIAPIAEYTGIPVWKRYISYPGHSIEEIKLAREYIKNNFSDYMCTFDKYMCGNKEFFCNMYIMKWKVFQEYCNWLFPILDYVSTQFYDNLGEKALGFLSERLFGIYFLKQKESHSASSYIEIPRVHFWKYDDEQHHFFWSRYINFLLPPGSQRRALVKCVLKKQREVSFYG